MPFQGRLKRDKEPESVYLSLLQQQFDVEPLEKYSDAMIHRIFGDSYDKVLGDNFDKSGKKKFGKRNVERIKADISKRVRGKYGPYINITNIKMKMGKKITFGTNLDRTFKVKGFGTLYGGFYHMCCGNVFFTTHSLKRFSERIKYEECGRLYHWTKKWLDAEPSEVDMMSMLINTRAIQYGLCEKGYYYINIRTGMLVMQDFGDIFIVKTYMSKDMVKPRIRWVEPKIDKDAPMNSFADIIKCESTHIDEPTFYNM